ncbi:endolytic transglycosylase MltG [soil metagenome]
MFETTQDRAERRSERHRRRRGTAILVAMLLVLIAVAVAVGGFYRYATGSGGPQRELTFTIPEGTTGSEVADLLEQKGVIRSTLGFRLMAQIRGSSLEFAAGNYVLKTNMSAGDVLDVLEGGPLLARGIEGTFPEGLRLEQMATRAAEELGVSRDGFLEAARSGQFALPPYLPEGTPSVEGFLFPSTYEFERKATAQDVIGRMLEQFETVAADLPWDAAEGLGLSPYEVVIVASLIEREARFQEDRPKISAVIHNRLREGMRLEIDATVQYALGDWDSILVTDREVESPFNTYQNAGLPPAPIASPGRASLEAALSPADEGFLYYVVIDAEGHHAFTDSYDEFLELVDRYQG